MHSFHLYRVMCALSYLISCVTVVSLSCVILGIFHHIHLARYFWFYISCFFSQNSVYFFHRFD